MQFYLRIEGVNLDNFVYDVADLSTVRGGSLLLLDAIDHAETFLRTKDKKLKSLSKGASAGLFRFEAKDIEAAAAVRQELEHTLPILTPALAHATFVVDLVKAGRDTDFQRNAESLLACNRWRQMHSLSLTVPPLGDDTGRVCGLDLVRPAAEQVKIKGDDYWLSTATAQRRKYGVLQKRAFYARAAKSDDLPPDFVNDLGDLSQASSKGNLHHKIALIYIDGNEFGRFRDKFTKPSDQERFDTYLRGKRNELLRQLMKTLHRESDEWRAADWLFFDRKTPGRDPGPQLRFETLLWGGDELIWVVPAWQGLRILRFFYEHARWEYEGSPLKHAAGLVFCHHDAPIHRIRRLAEALCGLAKDAAVQENRVAYQVLESFDHTGDDLTAFRAGRLPRGADPRSLTIPGDALQRALEAMVIFKAEFPKRKLHELVALTLQGEASAAAELAGQTLGPLPRARQALETLRTVLGGGSTADDSAVWLHLLDLWDYVVEEPRR